MGQGLHAARRLRGDRVQHTLIPKSPRFAVALAAAAAIILSAPFVQQAFTAVGTAWAPQSRAIGVAATALPVGIAVLIAVVRIRDRRPARYLAIASSLAFGTSYILINALSFGESFHFVEYGLLAWLFYRALRQSDDGSVILWPLLAGVLVGILDEWFQWFIPIRVGEAQDIVLDAVAGVCGLLFAIGVEPPERLTVALRRESLGRVCFSSAATVVLFALFFLTVHVGHDVHDAEIGVFRSRYTAAQLAVVARDRAGRWRSRPPLVQRRLSCEDQYLTEGLWHVQRRNQAWSAGDVADAWRENRILEKFYAPILDAPTSSGTSGHRWSAEQSADATSRPGVDRAPSVSDAYRYPLYVWTWGVL